jgi:hypothetical protein
MYRDPLRPAIEGAASALGDPADPPSEKVASEAVVPPWWDWSTLRTAYLDVANLDVTSNKEFMRWLTALAAADRNHTWQLMDLMDSYTLPSLSEETRAALGQWVGDHTNILASPAKLELINAAHAAEAVSTLRPMVVFRGFGGDPHFLPPVGGVCRGLSSPRLTSVSSSPKIALVFAARGNIRKPFKLHICVIRLPTGTRVLPVPQQRYEQEMLLSQGQHYRHIAEKTILVPTHGDDPQECADAERAAFHAHAEDMVWRSNHKKKEDEESSEDDEEEDDEDDSYDFNLVYTIHIMEACGEDPDPDYTQLSDEDIERMTRNFRKVSEKFARRPPHENAANYTPSTLMVAGHALASA